MKPRIVGVANGVLGVALAQLIYTTACRDCLGADRDWPTVGGDPGNSRYSTLTQINRTNVTRLQLGWTYHTTDAGADTTIECTPIVVGGILFATTPRCRVIALEGDTGHERWRFDPFERVRINQPRASGGVNRGLAYWTDGKRTRILLGAPD